nr:MAG TPA: hypothetical protein [Caudoviricetes sp.]
MVVETVCYTKRKSFFAARDFRKIKRAGETF